MSSSTAVLTDQSPAQIDGKLYPILDRLAVLDGHIGNYRWLLGEVGRKHVGTRSMGGRKIGDDGLEYNEPGVQRNQFEAAKATLEEEAGALQVQADPYEAEFERRGWTRYIVVSGGHLHFRRCHTLTPGRTMVGQVAEASGLAPGQVIGKFGETACTHCFPDAPVAPRKTPAEEGFCEHSGEWADAGARRYAHCDCGAYVAVTSRGLLRKHKAGVRPR